VRQEAKAGEAEHGPTVLMDGRDIAELLIAKGAVRGFEVDEWDVYMAKEKDA